MDSNLFKSYDQKVMKIVHSEARTFCFTIRCNKIVMTGNDNVLKLECEKKDISVYELCIQMLNVLIHFLRKEKDEIPPRIKFPTIVILISIIVD